MNKKANLFDPLIIIIVLFGFAISSVIFLLISHELKTDLTAKLNTPTFTASGDIITHTDDAIKSFDYIFVILVAMLTVSTLISAFFIKSHPIFFVVSTILLFVFMIPAVVLSNAFEKFTQQSQISTVMSDFASITFFMSKLPYLLLVIMILTIIVLFMYKGNGTGYE
jgi:hypothetical protein